MSQQTPDKYRPLVGMYPSGCHYCRRAATRQCNRCRVYLCYRLHPDTHGNVY